MQKLKKTFRRCHRPPHAMETDIPSLTTTTTPSLGRSSLTEENRHAVQKETANFKSGTLVLPNYYFECACKMNKMLFYTHIIDKCKDIGHQDVCFLARRRGQGVEFKI